MRPFRTAYAVGGMPVFAALDFLPAVKRSIGD